ncbi:hypothetical protein B0T25DRAFT_314073 [Lasiosphaeria hispida]|uniref:Uncharacterized protein n=1 Tax=Lasiosphaeria hispida TaxID=260671 RepID=A0AAJ0M9G8_9PEZI|nr:hypothetical protein B0T25DRAFT_314073 [Lasiosphaeria hispida]
MHTACLPGGLPVHLRYRYIYVLGSNLAMAGTTGQSASMTPENLSTSPSSSKRHLIKLLASPANAQSAQGGRRRKWDDGIPPILRPLVRAYLLGYVSAVAPRVLTLLLQHLSRRRHSSQAADKTKRTGKTTAHDSFWESLQHILYTGLDPRRFPAFCALVVGGSTLLEVRCHHRRPLSRCMQ